MSGKFNIDGDAIRKLAEILVETDLSEIEYEYDGSKVRVARTIPAITTVAAAPTAVAAAAAPLPQQAPEQQIDHSKHPGAIKSPMVGTVYSAAEPGAAPFVQVGDVISAGQTLLIIEAMKVMNPIKSPKSGKITHLFFSNAQPVEFGEPLLIIE